MDDPKAALIDGILELEMEMFLAVPTEGSCECKENIDLFGVHRKAQFQAWSEPTLRSYLEDLGTARRKGINLMTLKYARMEDKIPRYNTNPAIAELVDIMLAWQVEFLERHGRLKERARPLEHDDTDNPVRSFPHYLGSELETYSTRTLACLLEDIHAKRAAGVNMSEEIYRNVFDGLGYDSVDTAERSIGPADPG
ncbi:MAG: DUF4125 family protein [Rectinemataceae bacterium]|jgi:hypothetical protein